MTDPNLEAAGRRQCPRCQALVNIRVRVGKEFTQVECAVCGVFLESFSNKPD